MHFSTVFFGTFTLALTALGAPSTLVDVVKSSGATNGGYIVTLKSANASHSFAKVNNYAATHHYDIIDGFAGKFTDKQIEELRANSHVEGIYEDGITKVAALQTNATWGLARLSSKTKLQSHNAAATNFSFYHDPNAGRNVDIYIVDSGINLDHADFGERAEWGQTFGKFGPGRPFRDVDNDGHGTHCAGIAAGRTYGVAKQATVIAVKVLDHDRGYISDLLSGLQFVHKEVLRTRRRSVVSISLAFPSNTLVDNAVTKLTLDNITVVAAAGNEGTYANLFSPGHVASVIAVGASDIADRQATFSNYGGTVDLFAPGVDITSTWIGGEHAVKTLSGTSASTSYISGLVAAFLSQRKSTPAEMKDYLNTLALKGVLSGVSPNTPNLLAQNGLAP